MGRGRKLPVLVLTDGDRDSRLQQWIRTGKLEEALRLLARLLYEQGKLNPEEAFVDATFASAKKAGSAGGPTRRGKGTKIVAVAAGNSFPLAVSVASASPAQCRLVEEVLAGSFLDQLPARLIGDKAYDSDKHGMDAIRNSFDQLFKERYCGMWSSRNGRTRRRF